MRPPLDCTLQISLAPSDYEHAKYLLPHQIAALGTQVDEVLLTIDSKRSRGRFGENWNENQEKLNDLINTLQKTSPNIRKEIVDYSTGTRQAISKLFFEGSLIPDKDFRGGPFYSYFFGLYKASSKYVFHIDSDIFLGGGSQTWVAEALDMFHRSDTIFLVSPLPGPPHPEEKLVDQIILEKTGRFSFALKGMSTRVYLLNKEIFNKAKLTLQKPSLRNQIKALVEGNSNADLPEHLIWNFMDKHRLRRIDFLGIEPGLFTLHPPYRTRDFYKQIPDLLDKIQNSEFPTSQYGFYDIVDELVDWTEAKDRIKENRWWKRLIK
ncbi:hypothetical protein [Desertivirga arenae]|uniref:hypothetical protein n=1 Tax=Desertivirga arenae TaxID=2810309 RepID=UPI001A96BD53|nr:hypothetical protein [Pedobacter sp. SYSU D00823]